MIDELKDGIGVLLGDMQRFGAVLLISGIVLAVVLMTSFVPQLFAQTTNPYSTPETCSKSYYIFPIFMNLGNLVLATAEIQCVVMSVNLVAIILYYLEITGLLLLALYIGILVFHLNG